jgi:citrate lyase beta subunit
VNLRSLLFVPADSERKLARAADAAADAIILDLEDAVAEKNKPMARAMARTFLQSSPATCAQIWVRINALNTPDAQLDLEGVMAGKPYGFDIDAIDTVTIEVKDPNVLRADCVRAKAAGFIGKLAIHPDQLNVIHDVFVPSVEELDRASRIIATFAAAAGAGAVTLDGAMIDLVHLRAAQRLLSRAGARA